MIEFYIAIHYIVYRFYIRHKEERSTAMLYACCLHGLLFNALLIEIDWFCSRLLGFPCLFTTKYDAVKFMVAFLVFEYFVFYRKDRYLDYFEEYAQLSNTPVVKKRLKNAKIFNISIFVTDLIMILIIDYINNHL